MAWQFASAEPGAFKTNVFVTSDVTKEKLRSQITDGAW